MKKKKKKESVDELIRKLREDDLPPLERLEISLKGKVRERLKKEFDEKTEEEKIEHYEYVTERILLKIDELREKKEEIDREIDLLIKQKEFLMDIVKVRRIVLTHKNYEEKIKNKRKSEMTPQTLRDRIKCIYRIMHLETKLVRLKDLYNKCPPENKSELKKEIENTERLLSIEREKKKKIEKE